MVRLAVSVLPRFFTALVINIFGGLLFVVLKNLV